MSEPILASEVLRDAPIVLLHPQETDAIVAALLSLVPEGDDVVIRRSDQTVWGLARTPHGDPWSYDEEGGHPMPTDWLYRLVPVSKEAEQ